MSIPRVIIVIASSLDGRIAFPGGGESHLGSEEDKKMLNHNLSMVDATIFGLGTLIAHQSTYLIKNLNDNDEINLSKSQPISIVASNSKKFNHNWKYFRQPMISFDLIFFYLLRFQDAILHLQEMQFSHQD